MNYALLKLEFSPDPLSDTTPSWVDVTRFCMSASWSSGKAKDLDSPQAGSATFLLKNTGRMFEPEYMAGVFYPNIRPLRRFRLSLSAAGVTYPQGTYYATSWQVQYPAGTDYSTVTVTCTDGFGILSNTVLPAMDPASATSLPDVIEADNPLAFYTLADTAAKLNASVGPDGTYSGTRRMQQPPIVPGSPDTSVLFVAQATRASAKIDDPGWFSDPNAVTCECVFQTVDGTAGTVLSGPADSSGNIVFGLNTDSALVRDQTFNAISVTGSGTLRDGLSHHLAMTWDGNTLCMYEDGVLVASNARGGAQMLTAASGETLNIHCHSGNTGSTPITIQYAAFYATALSPARIAAHADAALNRGRSAETVGNRLAALSTSALWGSAHVAASQLIAAPRYFTGQSAIDEITTTVTAEEPIGLFYFRDDGDPAYYGWDDSRLITPAAIFGDL